MEIKDNLSKLSDGTLKATMKFFTKAGVHTLDKEYTIKYSIEETPAPVDILTFTSTADANCNFLLRNDTMKTSSLMS